MNNEYRLFSPEAMWNFCGRDPDKLESYGRDLWEIHVESMIPEGASVLREMVQVPNFYELALLLSESMEEFDPEDYRPMD